MATKELSRVTVETIRLQYASGLYSVSDLVDRWIPTITAEEFESILSYKVHEEIKPEVKTIVFEMGKLQDKMLASKELQVQLAYQVVDDNKLTVFEEFWDGVFEELLVEFPWLTRGIFRAVKSLPIANL